MLIVVVPVFILTFWIVVRYRASNKKATYAPDWEYSAAIDAAVWLVPAAIIVALGILLWSSTHKLDPFRPLDAATAPLEVEVIAQDWKWLFIYPEQEIDSRTTGRRSCNRRPDDRLSRPASCEDGSRPRRCRQRGYSAGKCRFHLHCYQQRPRGLRTGPDCAGARSGGLFGRYQRHQRQQHLRNPLEGRGVATRRASVRRWIGKISGVFSEVR